MNTFWRTKLSWSNTKQKVWDRCKREFYFDAIAKYEYAFGSEANAEVWWLSRLTPLNAVLGGVLHETLEQQVNQHMLGRPVSAESAKAYFTQAMDEFQQQAEKRIVEAVNGADIAPEFFLRKRGEGLRQLSNFFGIFWPNYENLEYLQHERFDSFEVGGIPVIVKLDLLSKSPDNQVVVTDWKTGHEDDAADTSLQLGVYVLWAQHKFGLPPDRIKAELAYLETGRTRVTSRTPLELAQLRQFIVRNGGAMMGVQDEVQLAASPEERKCAGCRFATACTEGRPFLRNPRTPYR